MEAAVDWLAGHPQVKLRAAELFGHSQQEIPHLLVADLHRTIEYAEVLYRSAVEYSAPTEVLDNLAEFRRTVTDGVAALDKGGPFLQKTLASLAGLQDLRDIKLVLRGALPHAPTEADRRH